MSTASGEDLRVAEATGARVQVWVPASWTVRRLTEEAAHRGWSRVVYVARTGRFYAHREGGDRR